VFLAFILILQLEFLASLVLFAFYLASFSPVEGSLYSSFIELPMLWSVGLVVCACGLSTLAALAMTPLLYLQLTNVCMMTTTRERFIVRPNQRRASTRSQRTSNSSERLIQAERELLVPMSIDSSALTDGLVFLATTPVCCSSDRPPVVEVKA
jgi:hypothetical protein